jgi:hypothetical protein
VLDTLSLEIHGVISTREQFENSIFNSQYLTSLRRVT